MHRSVAALLAGSAVVLASPAAQAPAPTPAASLAKRDSCTFSGSSGAEAASKSKASCATITISAVTVPSGTTLDLTDLEDNTAVVFAGTTTWEYDEWEGPLLSISGTGISVTGASGHVLDGQGAQWWDGEGDDGVTKPKFFYAHDMISSSISGINILNPPHQVVSINGASDLTIDSMTIDATDGDDNGGKNTDCFDISESDSITITNAVCKNQDDCVAVNSGTNIEFSGGVCSGGHGLSIGSVGGRDDNTVDTVTFSSSTVSNSMNGVRVKARAGDSGSITGVTYKDITLDSITDYGVLIEQNYDGGDLKGDPTTGIPITNLVLSGITGTVDSDGTNIAIVCGSGSCSDWTWDVSVSGGEDYDECQNIPDGATCTTS
ncbi:unnamed protein product [Discula destructiva]